MDETSRHFLEVYYALDGFSRLRTPSEMYDIPALYYKAVRIINNELRLIESQRKGSS